MDKSLLIFIKLKTYCHKFTKIDKIHCILDIAKQTIDFKHEQTKNINVSI